MDLVTMFDFAVSRHPAREAIVDGPNRYTYGQLHRRANVLAHALAELNLTAGDRVAICLRNREEFAALFFAIQRIGAVAAPFNFRLPSEDLKYLVNDAGAKALVFESRTREAILAARDSFDACDTLIYVDDDPPSGAQPFQPLLEGPPTPPPQVALTDEDLSTILYTSGSTGRPKGIPLTHRMAWARVIDGPVEQGMTSEDRVLGAMPLYHTIGLHAQLLPILMLGGTYVCIREFDPSHALRVIEAERITTFFGSPTHYYALVHAPDFGRYDLRAFTKLLHSGAPISRELLAELGEQLSRDLTHVYGNTETMYNLVRPHSLSKPGSVGRPGVYHQLRIVKLRRDGERSRPDDVVRPGEHGEVIVSLKSDQAFSGYWRKPEETARAIIAGWFYTGDMAYQDHEGEYFITGRVDDMILSGAENIYPEEVEAVIAGHPKVKDVAVVGVLDPRWGEVVKAVIVPRTDDLTAQEIERYCLESPKLADFKRPRKIEFVTELPRNPSGKLLRYKLRAR